MQFTTIVALTLAAVGVMASPVADAEAGYGGRGGRGRPSTTNNNNWNSYNNNNNQVNQQTISCGSGSGTYCCSPGYDSKGGVNYYDCSSFVGSCNAITTCCANNAQGGSKAGQNCSGLGSITVNYR
ncbi:hypothetical protein B0I35DRAFT_483970 [Stachybotrys elegans]|uniref:Hydrophobin n=1 Tax=Stachybotrys elegans TaxID=80388 RepID=A0A8K0SAX6_9HYPO|nr:hypothetical protein B0I35DRAFT_483970 [Stachybotrys elegans]